MKKSTVAKLSKDDLRMIAFAAQSDYERIDQVIYQTGLMNDERAMLRKIAERKRIAAAEAWRAVEAA